MAALSISLAPCPLNPQLRRLDYWDAGKVISNPPAKLYRPFGPGSGPVPKIQRSGEENVYNVSSLTVYSVALRRSG